MVDPGNGHNGLTLGCEWGPLCGGDGGQGVVMESDVDPCFFFVVAVLLCA